MEAGRSSTLVRIMANGYAMMNSVNGALMMDDVMTQGTARGQYEKLMNGGDWQAASRIVIGGYVTVISVIGALMRDDVTTQGLARGQSPQKILRARLWQRSSRRAAGNSSGCLPPRQVRVEEMP